MVIKIQRHPYVIAWDWNKSLREKDIPIWIILEAQLVHQAVIKKLKENK